MLAHRASEKAKHYVDLLDAARCDGRWEEVPELTRKVGKHAQTRKCLVLTAKCEAEISISTRSQTAGSSLHSNLSRLIPDLRAAIELKEASEDVFQAKVCLGWLHWILGQPVLALSVLITDLPLVVDKETEKQGTLSNWTHICIVKCVCIRGAAQEAAGTLADVMHTYRSGLSYLSKNNPAIENQIEYRMWAELLLTRSCMLSSKVSQPSAKAQCLFPDPEASLEPFRTWLGFWQSDPTRPSSKIDADIGKSFKRRAVWQAYYRLLSQLLDEGYTYPNTVAEKKIGQLANSGSQTKEESSPRFQQSREIWRVGAIYEGLLLKEVPFPQATETNFEVLEWVDRVMLNWRILCGPEWMVQDLGHGGQVVASRNVLDILYRAATRTFHSTSILRHLFTVHASLAEFDLAAKSLDSYLEIIMKGRARVEKSGQPEAGLDSDEVMLNTIAAGITMFTTHGGQKEAQKVQDLAGHLEKWLTNHNSSLPPDSTMTNGSLHTVEEITRTKSCILQNTMISTHRAIGISRAHWARYTYDASKRTELRAKAVASFRSAIELDENDAETLYALALVLAESRDIETAVATVKQALSTNTSLAFTKISKQDFWSRKGIERLVARRQARNSHLLSLLLSARQDFDTAETLCEAALDGTETSEDVGGNSSGHTSQTLGRHDKQHLVEAKMTQMAISEVMEGPENAVNAGGELLALYARLYKSTKGNSSAPITKPTSPPRTSNGTIRSIRSSVFGRSKDPRAGIYTATGPGSARSYRESDDISRAPTVSMTHNEELMHHHLMPPEFNEPHVVYRQSSKRLQKRASKKSIRSRTVSPARTVSTTRDSTLSFANHKAQQAGSTISSSEHYQPNTSRSYATDEVGVAVSHDLPTIPGSPINQSNDSSYPFQSLAPINHSAVRPHNSTRFDSQSLNPGLSMENSPFITPAIEPYFPQLEQTRHALHLLQKIWIFIAGLYRRAKMLDDAQEAVDEAFKHVKSIEASVASRHSSAQAFDTPGWGGLKSVEELWADAYAERGNLCIARSAPHEAIIQYESALSHYPDHPAATISLSNILLDIYCELIPPHPLTPSIRSGPDGSAASKRKESPQPLLASVQSPHSTISDLDSSRLPDSIDLSLSDDSSLNSSEDPPRTSSRHRKSPEALDRLAARDRAYGLLSSLTKLGTGWDNSEAWFALARSYEESGQSDKAKGVLWWVVELEEKRPIRDWSCLGQGYSL